MDPFCQQAAARVGNEKAGYTIDKEKLVVRKASVKDAIQVLVPTVLRKDSCITPISRY